MQDDNNAHPKRDGMCLKDNDLICCKYHINHTITYSKRVFVDKNTIGPILIDKNVVVEE